MKNSRRAILIAMCSTLAVVTVIFLIYRWNEQVKGGNSRPVLECPSYPLRISVTALENDEVLMQDVTASDREDGDITSSIVVESISQFVEPGHSIITYAACDSSNKVSKATRHLYLTDYTSPVFDIVAPLEFSYSSNFSPLACMRAYDCIDGDISSRVKMAMVNPEDELKTIGAHNVEFSVMNSMGDIVSIEAEVVVYDRTYTEQRMIPAIKLTHYLIYSEPNMYVDFLSMVKSINVGGESFSVESFESRFGELKIDDGGFDPGTPGVYRVLYTCNNGSDYIGSAVLIVLVKGGRDNG